MYDTISEWRTSEPLMCFWLYFAKYLVSAHCRTTHQWGKPPLKLILPSSFFSQSWSRRMSYSCLYESILNSLGNEKLSIPVKLPPTFESCHKPNQWDSLYWNSCKTFHAILASLRCPPINEAVETQMFTVLPLLSHKNVAFFLSHCCWLALHSWRVTYFEHCFRCRPVSLVRCLAHSRGCNFAAHRKCVHWRRCASYLLCGVCRCYGMTHVIPKLVYVTPHK